MEAIGEGVSLVKVGDRVCSSFFQNWSSGELIAQKLLTSSLGGPLDGCLTEKMILREVGVSKIPDWMSFEQAGTLPCAALTAWNALLGNGSLTGRHSLQLNDDRHYSNEYFPSISWLRIVLDRRLRLRSLKDKAQVRWYVSVRRTHLYNILHKIKLLTLAIKGVN